MAYFKDTRPVDDWDYGWDFDRDLDVTEEPDFEYVDKAILVDLLKKAKDSQGNPLLPVFSDYDAMAYRAKTGAEAVANKIAWDDELRYGYSEDCVTTKDVARIKAILSNPEAIDEIASWPNAMDGVLWNLKSPLATTVSKAPDLFKDAVVRGGTRWSAREATKLAEKYVAALDLPDWPVSREVIRMLLNAKTMEGWPLVDFKEEDAKIAGSLLVGPRSERLAAVLSNPEAINDIVKWHSRWKGIFAHIMSPLESTRTGIGLGDFRQKPDMRNYDPVTKEGFIHFITEVAVKPKREINELSDVVQSNPTIFNMLAKSKTPHNQPLFDEADIAYLLLAKVRGNDKVRMIDQDVDKMLKVLSDKKVCEALSATLTKRAEAFYDAIYDPQPLLGLGQFKKKTVEKSTRRSASSKRGLRGDLVKAGTTAAETVRTAKVQNKKKKITLSELDAIQKVVRR